jgi:putative ATP-binding cassette transporter
MDADRVSFDRTTWRRFREALRNFARSEAGRRATLLFGALLAAMVAINGLNVVNSYVGRDFMTAIEQRSRAGFVTQGLLYASVFAASTVVAVLLRFTEERLGLLWRQWLTGRLLHVYLDDRLYYRLREEGGVDNPDQRIADDTRSFTASTISFVLMLLNGTFTIVAFSGVLWSISPLLFVVAVGYAGAGSLLTVVLGRPLVGLNYAQFDRDASFRAELVHVRENAESVALTNRELDLGARLQRRLDALVANMKRIIAVNRNVSFFTTGYNYGVQLIPALVVGPLFMSGQVEFGVITQAAMAFSHLLGAFSLIITQFGSISSYAAVIARLSALGEAAETRRDAQIDVEEDSGDRLVYDGVTLAEPSGDRVLLDAFSAALEPGRRLLVTGSSESARAALFRASAGLWRSGRGRIVRPPADRIAFLPERPYVPPGTLRAALAHADDAALARVLAKLGLDRIVARAGGLDAEHDWDDALSLTQQQLLSVARVALAAPTFALLHQLGTTLDRERAAAALALLADAGVAVVLFGEIAGLGVPFDATLRIEQDGRWRWDAPARVASHGYRSTPSEGEPNA